MLFKLSLSNIRRSLRDYVIYFFTLIIGVSIFYVFNAIETQTAFIEVSDDTTEMIKTMTTILSGVSVFVSIVLGLLIVYASRFLMKRRNREFAIYMTLGMSKGKISAMLFFETVIIGIGSLVAGLLVGIGLSQLMSAFVVTLFEADMTSYKFTVSSDAIIKTIIYFAIMYLVVMVFNSTVISRLKLIDLIQSGRRAEKLHNRDPWLCIAVFIVSVIVLGYDYYKVGWADLGRFNERKLIFIIAIGAVSTFFIFWSLSGLVLRIVMSAKRFYYKGLNSFTFRQISSRVNTMVMSMTVICLMIFVTICLLSVAFSVRRTLNNGVKEFFPADFEISFYNDGETGPHSTEEVFAEKGYDVNKLFRDTASATMYDCGLTYGDVLGDREEEYRKVFGSNMMMIIGTGLFPVYTESEINDMLRFRGRSKDKLSLGEDGYAIFCNMKELSGFFDDSMSEGFEVTVNGHRLKPAYKKSIDNFVLCSVQRVNNGCIIVPDSVVEGAEVEYEHFWAWYDADSLKGRRAEEKKFLDIYKNAFAEYRIGDSEFAEDNAEDDDEMPEIFVGALTRFQLADEAVGIGAIATFLALYLGMVFLITSGAILGLKQLSESSDSIKSYEILRKIGAEEEDINKSLFSQALLFFLIPLILACIHSIVGMKFSRRILSFFISEGFVGAMIFTAAVLLVIYGGYFLITYLCSRSIIKGKRQ